MLMKFEVPAVLTRVPRKAALDILQSARLFPDRFTAHRNGTFTARYLRDREPISQILGEYESLLERADQRIAILKCPSPKLDRGRYVTLQFTFATFAA